MDSSGLDRDKGILVLAVLVLASVVFAVLLVIDRHLWVGVRDWTFACLLWGERIQCGPLHIDQGTILEL